MRDWSGVITKLGQTWGPYLEGLIQGVKEDVFNRNHDWLTTEKTTLTHLATRMGDLWAGASDEFKRDLLKPLFQEWGLSLGGRGSTVTAVKRPAQYVMHEASWIFRCAITEAFMNMGDGDVHTMTWAPPAVQDPDFVRAILADAKRLFGDSVLESHQGPPLAASIITRIVGR